VGVEYDVTSCDLGVFVDQAAEIAGRGPARTTDEPPWLVGGRIDGEHWSVVVTYRAQRVRIISARRSRKEQVALPPQASLVARVAGDATANQRAAFWCTERGYAAPVSTDSRQRRFSTPTFYPDRQRSGGQVRPENYLAASPKVHDRACSFLASPKTAALGV
jgi:uncharacterized DUF497 family protein